MSATQPISHKRGPGWQFSLLTLLVAMTCVGLMCVALGSPSELWTGVVFVLAVGSLLVAALSIVYRDGRARAFAVGFVIFGTTYFVVSMGDTPDVAEAHTQLPTTRWGIALYTLLHGEMQQQRPRAEPKQEDDQNRAQGMRAVADNEAKGAKPEDLVRQCSKT